MNSKLPWLVLGLSAFVACAGQTGIPLFDGTGGSGPGTGAGSGGGSSGAGGARTTVTSGHPTTGATSGKAGNGGAAGAGGTAGSAGSGAGAGGGSLACVHQADCAKLMDACNTANCVNNQCQQVPANDGATCDDGLWCTDADSCLSGVCAGIPKICSASDACHVGTCDEAKKACASAPGNDGASCTPTNNCFTSGSCANGVCANGSPVDCSALTDSCNVGACDPVSGCVKKAANDGAGCDDGLFCTVNDTCKAGVCAGTPNLCGGAPNDPCLTASCDEATKTCTAVPGNNGVACPATNPCLVGATCSNGLCAGGVAGNNGAACKDADACQLGATCSGGTCGNPTMTITQCVSGDGCCPPGCTFANDTDCKPPCGGYPAINGCWYLSALGDSCNNTCVAHGGFNAVAAQHTGNPICEHFYPQKTNGTNWEHTECCSTDNNTDWGANGMTPDPTWVFGACYLACACNN